MVLPGQRVLANNRLLIPTRTGTITVVQDRQTEQELRRGDSLGSVVKSANSRGNVSVQGQTPPALQAALAPPRPSVPQGLSVSTQSNAAGIALATTPLLPGSPEFRRNAGTGQITGRSQVNVPAFQMSKAFEANALAKLRQDVQGAQERANSLYGEGRNGIGENSSQYVYDRLSPTDRSLLGVGPLGNKRVRAKTRQAQAAYVKAQDAYVKAETEKQQAQLFNNVAVGKFNPESLLSPKIAPLPATMAPVLRGFTRQDFPVKTDLTKALTNAKYAVFTEGGRQQSGLTLANFNARQESRLVNGQVRVMPITRIRRVDEAFNRFGRNEAISLAALGLGFIQGGANLKNYVRSHPIDLLTYGKDIGTEVFYNPTTQRILPGPRDIIVSPIVGAVKDVATIWRPESQAGAGQFAGQVLGFVLGLKAARAVPGVGVVVRRLEGIQDATIAKGLTLGGTAISRLSPVVLRRISDKALSRPGEVVAVFKLPGQRLVEEYTNPVLTQTSIIRPGRPIDVSETIGGTPTGKFGRTYRPLEQVYGEATISGKQLRTFSRVGPVDVVTVEPLKPFSQSVFGQTLPEGWEVVRTKTGALRILDNRGQLVPIERAMGRARLTRGGATAEEFTQFYRDINKPMPKGISALLPGISPLKTEVAVRIIGTLEKEKIRSAPSLSFGDLKRVGSPAALRRLFQREQVPLQVAHEYVSTLQDFLRREQAYRQEYGLRRLSAAEQKIRVPKGRTLADLNQHLEQVIRGRTERLQTEIARAKAEGRIFAGPNPKTLRGPLKGAARLQEVYGRIQRDIAERPFRSRYENFVVQEREFRRRYGIKDVGGGRGPREPRLDVRKNRGASTGEIAAQYRARLEEALQTRLNKLRDDIELAKQRGRLSPNVDAVFELGRDGAVRGLTLKGKGGQVLLQVRTAASLGRYRGEGLLPVSQQAYVSVNPTLTANAAVKVLRMDVAPELRASANTVVLRRIPAPITTSQSVGSVVLGQGIGQPSPRDVMVTRMPPRTGTAFVSLPRTVRRTVGEGLFAPVASSRALTVQEPRSRVGTIPITILKGRQDVDVAQIPKYLQAQIPEQIQMPEVIVVPQQTHQPPPPLLKFPPGRLVTPFRPRLPLFLPPSLGVGGSGRGGRGPVGTSRGVVVLPTVLEFFGGASSRLVRGRSRRRSFSGVELSRIQIKRPLRKQRPKSRKRR